MKKFQFAFPFFMIAIMLISCVHAEEIQTSHEGVILVHGFARNQTGMEKIGNFLKQHGYSVYYVDYSSLGKPIEDIKNQVDAQILEIIGKHRKIHFVGHSLGGLLARSFIDRHKTPSLGRVVTMGSPAKGTPVVEYLQDRWWFSFAGEAALALGSQGSAFLKSIKQPNYELGVIAGVESCFDSEKIIGGANDGLVPVSSTRVQGMKDFITLPVNHAYMRYDKQTIFNVLHFIQFGKFYDNQEQKSGLEKQSKSIQKI